VLPFIISNKAFTPDKLDNVVSNPSYHLQDSIYIEDSKKEGKVMSEMIGN